MSMLKQLASVSELHNCVNGMLIYITPIDLFRQTGDDQIAIILQSNYICMGDIARYRASAVDKQSSGEQWRLAKECYQKAAEVYRFSGKPYSQMALVSISNGSVIDVVWYYCMR